MVGVLCVLFGEVCVLFGVLCVLFGVLCVLFGVIGILFGVICVLFGVLGVLFCVLGVLFDVFSILVLSFCLVYLVYFSSQKKCTDLGFYSLNKLFEKQSLSRSLWKKVRRLEKGTPPQVVRVVTIIRYGRYAP